MAICATLHKQEATDSNISFTIFFTCLTHHDRLILSKSDEGTTLETEKVCKQRRSETPLIFSSLVINRKSLSEIKILSGRLRVMHNESMIGSRVSRTDRPCYSPPHYGRSVLYRHINDLQSALYCHGAYSCQDRSHHHRASASDS